MRRLLLVAVVAVCAFAHGMDAYVARDDANGYCSEDHSCYWNITGGVLHIRGSGQMDNYTERSQAPWFDHTSLFDSVIVEGGITEIGDYAFYGTSIKSVTIEGTISYLGKHAFDGCSSLESVTLDKVDGVIGEYAFNRCTKLEDVGAIPAVEIGDYAFDGCTKLKGIDVISARSIGKYAFDGCTGLRRINITSAKVIGAHAFNGCTGLSVVHIFNATEEIGEAAFSDCDRLTSAYLTNGLVVIGSWAFSNSGLTRVNLPYTVKNISSSAFMDCDSMEYVTYQGVRDPGYDVNGIRSTDVFPRQITRAHVSPEYDDETFCRLPIKRASSSASRVKGVIAIIMVCLTIMFAAI